VKNIFEEEIKYDRPYIIAPNHTSYIDIATITSALVLLDFSFIAKAELLKVPL
jgi:1-acyl-sn-glycerol-3-phosphate acyltransferase